MSIIRRLTIEEFIRRAKETHGDTYDYSKFDYKSLKTKGCIICDIHGDYWQTPGNHIKKGTGCPKCATHKLAKAKILKAARDFEKKASKVHDDFYGYFWSLYRGVKTPIWIHCPKPNHGYFSQIPNDHLKGCGCPKCADEARSGWRKTDWESAGRASNYFKAFQLYVIRCWDENEEFYKVGITYTEVKRRFRDKWRMPYSWEIIQIVEGEAREIYNLENQVKAANKHLQYIPKKEFGGDGECLSDIPNQW